MLVHGWLEVANLFCFLSGLDESRDLVIWESAELAVSIIAVSIPFARLPIWNYYKKKRAKSRLGSTTGGQLSGTRDTRTHQQVISESSMVPLRRRDGDEVDDVVPPLPRTLPNPNPRAVVDGGAGTRNSLVTFEQFLKTAPDMSGGSRRSGGIMITREVSIGRHQREVSDDSEESVGYQEAWAPQRVSNV